MNTAAEPRISVIIPTFNRAAFLAAALASLAEQTLPHAEYEVVVVDDGSEDRTHEICFASRSRLNLTYHRIAHSGIAVAKNIGVLAAHGPILLFADDDDLADRNLLEEHLNAHKTHPVETIGILGYTDWAAVLQRNPVMEYVTEVGQLLFSYPDIPKTEVLDFTYFWGGRSSCKKSLLIRHGLFDPRFTSILEDIELGYRLSEIGFRVVLHQEAVSHMARRLTYEEFCARCERRGEALLELSRLHQTPVIAEYCQTTGAAKKWQAMQRKLDTRIRRVERIEALLADARQTRDQKALAELWDLYEWTFEAFRIKGIATRIGGTSVEPPARVLDQVH